MLTDFAEVWWTVCNLTSQCWRRLSLKSDVVCHSYGNVYSVIVFSWTRCRYCAMSNCQPKISPLYEDLFPGELGAPNLVFSKLAHYELTLKISLQSATPFLCYQVHKQTNKQNDCIIFSNFVEDDDKYIPDKGPLIPPPWIVVGRRHLVVANQPKIIL